MNCWDDRKNQSAVVPWFLVCTRSTEMSPRCQGSERFWVGKVQQACSDRAMCGQFFRSEYAKEFCKPFVIFHWYEGRLVFAGQPCLALRGSARAEGTQRYHSSKNMAKTLMVFSFVLFMCLILSYSPVSFGVHFVLHSLKHVVEGE